MNENIYLNFDQNIHIFWAKNLFMPNFFCQTPVETYQTKPKTLNSNPKIYLDYIKISFKTRHPSPKYYFHFRPDPSEISSPLLSRALGETNAEESKKIAWQLFEKLHETFYRAKWAMWVLSSKQISCRCWKVTRFSCNIWQYLAVSGSVWQYPALSRSIWQYPAVFYSIRQYLTVSNSFGQHLAVYNIIRQYPLVSGGSIM